jgi:tetratricopeptide (TPR) repeat protein
MKKIALHMIVAGTEKPSDVIRCMKSIEGQVDGVFITITTPMKQKNLKRKLEKAGAIVDYEPKKFFKTVDKEELDFLKGMGLKPFSKVGDKVFQFDKARNHNMAQVPDEYEWMIWLDADDVWRGDRLRKVVETAEKRQIDSVYFNYIYESVLNEDGSVRDILVEHLRERLFRNNGFYKWVAPIHETIIEQKPTRKSDNYECDVLHLSPRKKRVDAIHRNLKALELSIYKTKAKDPRPVYYLGKALFDMFSMSQDKSYLPQCELLFKMYLNGPDRSGWAEERSQCLEYLVEIYRVLGKYDRAIEFGLMALKEDERFPSIYINMAMTYLVKKEFERALFWIRLSKDVPKPKTTLISNPRDLQARALEVIYHACLNTSKVDQAWAASRKLLEYYPDKQEFKDKFKFIDDMRNTRDLTKSFVQVATHLNQTGQGYKLQPLLQGVPESIESTPFVVNLRNQVIPAKKWGDKEIAIFVGACFTKWSPKSLTKPGENFVGGSEEAVIYLSEELAKQGWKVTVFADPANDAGEYNGVRYLPHYHFNKRDEFNILIGWRRADIVDQNFKAKKTYVWCHDIQNQLDYTPERIEKITKVIVLSDWHRKNIPNVPDNKIMISSNGVKI